MPIIIHNGCALCDLPCRRNAQFGWTNPGRGCGMSGQGNTGRRQRVVIVGGGFAGFHAARRLARLAKGSLEVVLVNPTDYFLYLPLLPEVAAGILDPRRVAAPLATTCRGVRHVLGAVTELDMADRQVVARDPEGNRRVLGYDQLVLALYLRCGRSGIHGYRGGGPRPAAHTRCCAPPAWPVWPAVALAVDRRRATRAART